MSTKLCSSCKENKNLEQFQKDSRKSQGVRSRCRDCANEARRLSGKTPPGHLLKGVSTLYAADGSVKAQWVKSANDNLSAEAFSQLILESLEPIRGTSIKVKKPADTNKDILALYPMGDPHFGMYSWSDETGSNFDLKIAEQSLIAAVDHLVSVAPPASTAIVASLGDFFHTDNSSNRTSRSGATLDVDSRWSRVLKVGLRAFRRTIDMALTKHQKVHVICEIGNHDDHSAVALAHALSLYYENNERVTVDLSPALFHWYRFEKNLIGFTHGDKVKRDKLPGVMAVDRAADWGETTNRYWYIGHVHHDRLTEFPGCIVESFRTLASSDAWHAGQGYRSQRDMKVDVIHKDWGKVERHIVGIRQLGF